MLRFAEFVNVEYGDKGVVSYCVHPGAIFTEMSDTLPDALKPLLVDKLELAAHTFVWLINERREWLAGRYVSCHWDMEALLAKKQEIIDGDKLKVRMVV